MDATLTPGNLGMHDAFCKNCGAKLVPALGILKCPRMGSCGRGGLLEGSGVEIVRTHWAGDVFSTS